MKTEILEVNSDSGRIMEGDIIEMSGIHAAVIKIIEGNAHTLEFTDYGKYQSEVERLTDDMQHYPYEESTSNQLKIIKQKAKREGEATDKSIKINQFTKENNFAKLEIKILSKSYED